MIFKLANKTKEYSLDELTVHLSNIRTFILTNKIALEICDEFGYNESILMGVPIVFSSDLDVSAKTIDGQMILNSDLIEEGYEILLRYVIHELVHVFQHIENKSKKDLYPDHEYLDRPDELEAFKYQIEFDESMRGEKDVIEYVEGLLEHHDVPSEEKIDKAVELMEKI